MGRPLACHHPAGEPRIFLQSKSNFNPNLNLYSARVQDSARTTSCPRPQLLTNEYFREIEEENSRTASPAIQANAHSEAGFRQSIRCMPPTVLRKISTGRELRQEQVGHRGLPISHAQWDNTNICINRSTLYFNYWRPGRFCWGMPRRNRLRQQRLVNLLNPPPPPRPRRRQPPRRHP